MKPIATVHWTEDGIDKSINIDNQGSLESFTALLRYNDHPYYVCMLTLTDNIHFKTQKRPYRHIS